MIDRLFDSIHQDTLLKLQELYDQKNHFLKSISLLKKLKKNRKKVLIFGNGGSAATSSHFSVDLTKNAKTRCVNFNDADLITCFSNDYGFENSIMQAINSYYDKGDMVILLSVSGESKNILNAARFCKKNKISLITLTGKSKKNNLIKINNKGVNFFINSKSYNTVEILHSYILLTLVDIMIGKKVYGTNIGKIW